MSDATREQWLEAYNLTLPVVRSIRYWLAPDFTKPLHETILECWEGIGREAAKFGYSELFAATDPHPPDWYKARLERTADQLGAEHG